VTKIRPIACLPMATARPCHRMQAASAALAASDTIIRNPVTTTSPNDLSRSRRKLSTALSGFGSTRQIVFRAFCSSMSGSVTWIESTLSVTWRMPPPGVSSAPSGAGEFRRSVRSHVRCRVLRPRYESTLHRRLLRSACVPGRDSFPASIHSLPSPGCKLIATRHEFSLRSGVGRKCHMYVPCFPRSWCPFRQQARNPARLRGTCLATAQGHDRQGVPWKPARGLLWRLDA
jgi:hypothetical protein